MSKNKLPVLLKATTKGQVQEWEIWAEDPGDGTGVMVTRYGLRDGKKQTLREVIAAGKNAGRKNATTPFQQAEAEVKARWTKQKDRKGYGLTVEDSKSVRAASPMLAQKYAKGMKKVDWANAFVQPKLDGFRCLATISPDGTVKLTSRENKPLPALASLADIVKGVRISVASLTGTDELVLDGELYAHGMSLNEISSACKKKSEKSERIQYHLYDALLPTPFATRSVFVRDVVSALGNDRLHTVKTVKVKSEAELEVCEQEFLADGYEGAMLRHGKTEYEAGRRSWSLLKVKTFQDDEFEVLDYKDSRGKYSGVPTYICQTKDGNPFDVLAHGTIPEKQSQMATVQDAVGKKLTVKFIYYTKTDKPVPYCPVAKGFRDPKTGLSSVLPPGK